jgi:hypothetical protein
LRRHRPQGQHQVVLDDLALHGQLVGRLGAAVGAHQGLLPRVPARLATAGRAGEFLLGTVLVSGTRRRLRRVHGPDGATNPVCGMVFIPA